MRLPRSSGILLHPTSLPSRFGIGDVGPSALDFLDVLAATGQRWWQTLPIGPTGYGNSPYQSYSSFAGNPLLISPERMSEKGWLSPKDWAEYPPFPEDRVEFDAVIEAKERLLQVAYENFRPEPPEFSTFVSDNASWLDDYALFMALKRHNGGTAWYEWEPGLVRRDLKSLDRWREKLSESMRFYRFVQFVFASQWSALREEARSRGLSMLGDLPIFVAHDSADVWARPDLFCLDEKGRPTVVAGVPPDAFAPVTGQLWGNPLYHWPAHGGENYAWWVSRIKAQTDRMELIRLDHFRGFEAYWEIPADSPTAAEGRWAHGPGTAFFEAVRDGLGALPLVAEDLGEITEEVYALRDRFNLPGMRVLQFGLEGTKGTEFHLPYTYVNHCIAYTGTHDNDTTVGWFSRRPSGTADDRRYATAQRLFARRLIGSAGDEFHWDLVRVALGSVADTVIVPMQDVLGLGSAARMNVPGNPKGNWTWRYRPGQVRPQSRERLAEITAVTGRWNGSVPERYGPPAPPEAGLPLEDAAPAAAFPSPVPPEPAPSRPGKAPKAAVKARPKSKK